ncbi:ribose-5-phosphate isomerase [Bombilactobacillus bombi]|uniref:Ribose-5-phosphate isomerase n=1 Tax=Bombilactobacillus bombi TaxID=1303590 RepID=A0A3R6ZZM3_9LACO|nr:RpiB/LacA/LacB family sugar-phosphate isomerase [Bombilactobacillus bombi]RHW52287.1 ribose-5-phosphate isomerase [Bombilactobacillus bombi]
MKLICGCDPAAFKFYKRVIKALTNEGYDLEDVGCKSSHEADGGKFAEIVGNKVISDKDTYGFLMCGTGQGMAMSANKIPGIRATLCYDVLPAVLSKNDNNGNILCTGAWMMEKKGLDYTMAMIHAWLFSEYTGTHEDGMAALKHLDSIKQ